jgi:ribosomal-protein-alanine N-acetyltransferase
VVTTRLVDVADADTLASLLTRNRQFLAPFEPTRDDSFFTADGQRTVIEEVLRAHELGTALPHVIVDDDGGIIGRITLYGISRGALLSCSTGYWVSESAGGRGVATAAVARITALAFDELGLHRVQAETLLDNGRSQRVLERNGFIRYGLAPQYLKIAGRWQDVLLYQLLSPHPEPMLR